VMCWRLTETLILVNEAEFMYEYYSAKYSAFFNYSAGADYQKNGRYSAGAGIRCSPSKKNIKKLVDQAGGNA